MPFSAGRLRSAPTPAVLGLARTLAPYRSKASSVCIFKISYGLFLIGAPSRYRSAAYEQCKSGAKEGEGMPHDGEPIFALPEPSLRKDPKGPGAKISEPAWGMSSPPKRRGDLARPRPSTDLSTDLAQP